MLSSKTVSLALAATAAAAASSVSVAAPIYTSTQLQASDRTGNKLNMPVSPTGVTIQSGSSLTLGDGKHLAFRLSVPAGSSSNDGLWYGQNAVGGMVATSSSIMGNAASGMSAAGKLIFTASGNYTTIPASGTKAKGLWTFDGTTYTSLAGGDVSWSSPTMKIDGTLAGAAVNTSGSNKVLRQYTIGGGSSDFTTGTTSTLLGGVYSAGGNYFAVRNGSSQVTRVDSVGNTVVMSTGFTGVGNSTYDVAGNGAVAFFGALGGVTQLNVTSDGTNFTQVAAVGATFSSLDSNFAPVINENGWVAFEATPVGGTKGLYVWDGTSAARVIGVNDVVTLANATTTTATSLASFFDLNSAGDVVFSVGYSGGGRGVYVASVPEPTTIGALMSLSAIAMLKRRRVGRSIL